MNQSCNLIGIVAPFLAALLLCGTGVGSAYVLQTRYNNEEVAEERGAAGLLLVGMIGSFVFTLIALAVGAYASPVCWLMPG